jgi:hypothetical protein
MFFAGERVRKGWLKSKSYFPAKVHIRGEWHIISVHFGF